jgi:peptidoglycan/LPS O-acetylase OafA/YrhL
MSSQLEDRITQDATAVGRVRRLAPVRLNRQGADRRDLYARLSVPGAAVTHHQRWASVDALRAIAALMVLASHAPQLGPSQQVGLLKEAPRLGVGVWIFFAASGYLIAGPFLRALLEGRPSPPLARYALRRTARILPAYWVAFAAILLLATGSRIAHWWQLPVHAALLQGLVPNELKSIYLVAWSLSVEVIFYMLVPLGAWIVRRKTHDRPVPLDHLIVGVLGLWCLMVLGSLALAVAFPLHEGHPLPGGVQVLALVGSLANFCPGMLVFLALTARDAGASRWGRRYTAVTSRPLPTLALAGVLFIVATQLPFETSGLSAAAQGPLFGLASGLVLATFVHGDWTRPIARVLAPIGLVSYGIYLWHWVILSALVHHGIVIHEGLYRFVILVLLSLPVAALSWLFVERPLLRRTTGWERRRSAKAAAMQPHDEVSASRALPPTGQTPVPVSSRP